jgi:hypothetical protein
VTAVETKVERRTVFRGSGAPSPRGLATSVALHLAAVLLLLLIPVKALTHTASPKPVDVVFHRPRPPVAIPVAPPPASAPKPTEKAGRPATAVPKNPIPPAPQGPGEPDKPMGPESQPAEKIGNVGILAFRDKLASLAKDKTGPRLGADARYSDAVDRGHGSSPSALTTNAPGSSGGIDASSLRRNVGGGGGGAFPGVGGGGPGGTGIGIAPVTSPIAPGGDRPSARGGPGPGRTDEEIQIVFDRYKAQFYRLYNRELRKDPTLKGQMVLKLTIEPDGSVSMCRLQSSDMNAPELADQVVAITKTINFGAKEVPALTISYPIDFLPAT